MAAMMALACAVGGCARDDQLHGSSEIEFDHVSHAVRVADDDELGRRIVAHSFQFVNRGECPVKICEVKTDCACLSAEYPKEPIAPGQSGEVALRIKLAGRIGRIETVGLVAFEGGSQPPVSLTLTAFVREPPFLRTESLEFGPVVPGEGRRRCVELVVPLEPEETVPGIKLSARKGLFRCTDLTGAKPRVQEDLEWSARFACFDIECAVEDGNPGTESVDSLVINVEHRKRPVVLSMRAMIVHPQLSVDPATLVFGGVATDVARRRVVVHRKRQSDRPISLTVDTDDRSLVSTTIETSSRDPADACVSVEVRPGTRRFFEGDLKIRLVGDDGLPYVLHYSGYNLLAH
jgi:hypothetical protein